VSCEQCKADELLDAADDLLKAFSGRFVKGVTLPEKIAVLRLRNAIWRIKGGSNE
jgi:hypothetical protein